MTLLLGELKRKTSRSRSLEEELQRCAHEIDSLREAVLQKEARLVFQKVQVSLNIYKQDVLVYDEISPYNLVNIKECSPDAVHFFRGD